MFGITTIATGDKAKEENTKCINSYRRLLPDTPMYTFDEKDISDSFSYSDKQKSRYIKTQLPNLIPDSWSRFLYVDSDTRLQSNTILEIDNHLKNDYDLVIVPSKSQSFWHIGEDEKEYTANVLEYYPMQFQCGLFGCKVNDRTKQLFRNWWFEWVKFSDNDQLAFIRALHVTPVKIWLMGFPFNSDSGTVVKHLFGVTR